MKNLSVIAVALLAAACSSTPREPEPMAVPPIVASADSDPRVAEMQTQLTELLERIDVLNQRIAQLEEIRVEATPAPQPPAPRRQAAVAEQPAESAPASAAAPAPAPPPVSAPVSSQAPLVAAQTAEDYRQAITLFGRGRHADARRAFESVYESDRTGDLADNALFWIGETYFAAKDYTNAVRYYQRVVGEYATENKAPDALFKIAMAQERTGDLALARRTLQQVIERYPYSSPASSAKAELNRIKY